MAPSEATAVSAVINDLPTEEAFDATLPEMAALGVEELTPINIDVVSAATTVLGCLAKLGALRSEIQTHLPTFDLERFDELKLVLCEGR